MEKIVTAAFGCLFLLACGSTAGSRELAKPIESAGEEAPRAESGRGPRPASPLDLHVRVLGPTDLGTDERTPLREPRARIEIENRATDAVALDEVMAVVSVRHGEDVVEGCAGLRVPLAAPRVVPAGGSFLTTVPLPCDAPNLAEHDVTVVLVPR